MVDDAVPSTATLSMTFASAAQAKTIQAALAPEDAGWVTSRLDGATLHAEIRADRLGEFVRTVDDYLGGVTAAVRAANAVAPKGSGASPPAQPAERTRDRAAAPKTGKKPS